MKNELSKIVSQKFIWILLTTVIIIFIGYFMIFATSQAQSSGTATIPTTMYNSVDELSVRIAENEDAINHYLDVGDSYSLEQVNRLTKANNYYKFLLENEIEFGNYYVYDAIEMMNYNNSYTSIKKSFNILIMAVMICAIALGIYLFSYDFLKGTYTFIYVNGNRKKKFIDKFKTFVLLIFILYSGFFILSVFNSLIYCNNNNFLLINIGQKVYSINLFTFSIVLYFIGLFYLLEISIIVYLVQSLSLNLFISLFLGIISIAVILSTYEIKHQVFTVFSGSFINVFTSCSVTNGLIGELLRLLIMVPIFVVAYIRFNRRDLKV